MPRVIPAAWLFAATLVGLAQTPATPPPGGSGPAPQEPPANPTRCAEVRLEANETEQISVLIDGVLVTTLKRLKEAGGTLLTNCVSLRVADDQESIQVGGSCRSVCLGGRGFEGWEAQVPLGTQVEVKADFGRGLLDFTALANNPAPVTLSFIDGATLQFPSGTGGRLDVFADKTYVFSARGPLTGQGVAGRNGEGKDLVLSSHTLPMTGGPEVDVKGADGTVQRVRLSPTVAVELAGSIGGEISVKVGDRTVTLGRTSSERITLPNGAVVTLGQNPATRTVNWQVEKGDFRISVADIGGWTAVGATGLSGDMAWNVDSQSVAIDIRNTTSPNPANVLLVALPANVTARVAPGATFQYAGAVGSNDFQTSSLNGSVVLANVVTGQVADLESGNMSFANGRPLIPGGALQPNGSVTLAWNPNAAVEMSGTLGDFSVPPGGSKEVRGPNGSLLRVVNRPGLGLILQAVSGDFTFNTEGVRSGTITLPQGSTIQLGYDIAGGIFTATPSRGVVTVTSADGSAKQIAPGTLMTVINGRLTTSSARAEDDLVFFQTLQSNRAGQANDSTTEREDQLSLEAGAGGSSFQSTLSGGNVNNQLDISRINQPPVTTGGRP